jgi:hypothetical protein
VPAEYIIEEGFYEELFENETKDEKLVTWEHFRENLVNKWPWKMVDRDQLEETVNEFFALSYKYKM